MIRSYSLIFTIFIFQSCSYLSLNNKALLNSRTQSFSQEEEAGEFLFRRKVGFDGNKNYVVKSDLTKLGNEDIALEKTITISKVKTINKKLRLLIPQKSESQYFLDGKKYFSRISISDKKITVKMISPEKQWNGEKEFVLTKGNGNICFYANIVECAIVSGFLSKAIETNMGKMNFYIVWEGYPYFHEQFLNIPNEVFSRATLVYDGVNRRKEHRLTLSAGGQSQFYFVDKEYKIIRHVWSSQGFQRESR